MFLFFFSLQTDLTVIVISIGKEKQTYKNAQSAKMSYTNVLFVKGDTSEDIENPRYVYARFYKHDSILQNGEPGTIVNLTNVILKTDSDVWITTRSSARPVGFIQIPQDFITTAPALPECTTTGSVPRKLTNAVKTHEMSTVTGKIVRVSRHSILS